MSLIPALNSFNRARRSPGERRYLDTITTDWQTIMLFEFTTGKWTELA